MKLSRYFWPAVGLCAVGFSIWLLYNELRGISLDDLGDSLAAIPTHRWLLAALSSVLAYAALAGYDHIALTHLGKKVPFGFITVCSFTTYALSHNIGGSVLSGAVIRYRAYATQGLSGQEVGVLVALCSFTFALGAMLLGAFLLLIEPEVFDGFVHFMPVSATRLTGLALLCLIGLYIFGSWLQLRPLRIGKFAVLYPRLPIVARQLAIAPIELIGAAGIIYFALPEAGNPGFMVVLGVFLVSFSAALISHAPGGLGVLEIVFIAGLSQMDPVAVLSALLVFRLFYLIVPLLLALVVVLGFERSRFGKD
ncbi:lysylphosphatidylglycerol synthase domain-containing protein [Mesorhizobium sp. LHD-90]|uniref:lysylphosphatidylglycerol synthase domain-containing protein n=1 Tax=Mesorhizobium sp. LHD-90 TaxID=3071414 RepID=UPI0027E0A4B5|nr:lysylphosphatidylglycerol synthase domain-containing protein [Mesorhizobium sp. LHD-90]MDQ6434972.1 lysylphosphatidylglycerol synthase domain-containing protein [Mesorhizobium sp. LHD-90]